MVQLHIKVMKGIYNKLIFEHYYLIEGSRHVSNQPQNETCDKY